MVQLGTGATARECERAHHKLPPKFFQLGASRRRQVSTTAAANASATDASGTSTSVSGPGCVLSTPQLLQLSRQLLDLRHRQRELFLLLVKQRPYAVQVRGCEHQTEKNVTTESNILFTNCYILFKKLCREIKVEDLYRKRNAFLRFIFYRGNSFLKSIVLENGIVSFQVDI